MVQKTGVTLEPKVTVNGIDWYLFTIGFNTPDGYFETYIYAIDFDHAEMRLQELKDTGVITGQVRSVVEKRDR